MKTRVFKSGVCNHIYQRTKCRFNIFYDLSDYLVYYTIFATAALRYNVDVLGLCLMIDHIHMIVSSRSRETLSNFISYVSSVFVRQYNDHIGRHGPLFEERFGSALKADRKKLVSSIIYLANNPVEKHVCNKAEDYRWNFIAFIGSPAPFSNKILRRDASKKLRKALSIVDWHRTQCKYLSYGVLDKMLEGMTPSERNQLADYVITKYNVIDHNSLKNLFGSYEQLLTAVHSTTGSEYDIPEYWDKLPDSRYLDMLRLLRERYGDCIRKIITCSTKEKLELAEYIRLRTAAPMSQICKFLHLDASYR